MSSTSAPSSRTRSYVYFRIFIGWIGITFPFVLLVGQRIFQGCGILDAISDYNYSPSMRNVFVGGLVALGMLLIAYHYDRVDTLVSTLAGLAAMGVAFFPEEPPGLAAMCVALSPEAPQASPSRVQQVVGMLHFGFATTFFLILAYMALFRFTKPAAPVAQASANLARLVRWKSLARRLQPSDAALPSSLTHRKRLRNHIYRVCGAMIVVCIALLLVLVRNVVPVPAQVNGLHPVYWVETLAILAFGAAWIIKGNLILVDEGTGPDPVQRSVAKVLPWYHPVTKR